MKTKWIIVVYAIWGIFSKNVYSHLKFDINEDISFKNIVQFPSMWSFSQENGTAQKDLLEFTSFV